MQHRNMFVACLQKVKLNIRRLQELPKVAPEKA